MGRLERGAVERLSDLQDGPITRRAFGRRLGDVVAAAWAWSAWPARNAWPPPHWPVGIQLYMVRSLMRTEADSTLAALAAIGYGEVELAGLYGMTAATMRALLDRHGLVAPSSHLSLQALRDEWPQCLEDAHTLGQRFVVCPWIDEADRTLQGYRKVAEQFNSIGAAAHRGGLQFAFHDHDYMHYRLPNGVIPYEIILDECDPELVQMEMDLYWIVKGGGDPMAYFERWPGRFPMLHVKDISRTGAMVDVGQGTIDFAAIRRRAEQAGVMHWFVEHDDPPSPLASARTSYAFLAPLIAQPTPAPARQ